MKDDRPRKKPTKKHPSSFTRRSYRQLAIGRGLVSSLVKIGETDLHVLAKTDVTELVKEQVLRCRLQLESYIGKYPQFATSLAPLPMDELAPPLIREMLMASRKVTVGPMAAVAGAIAGYVGSALASQGIRDVVVENGGDIYLNRSSDCTTAIFAGNSPLSYTTGIRIPFRHMPCGVCTSSGTVGHSLSFGDADSVTVVADSVALADATATRLGNEVGTSGESARGIEQALQQAEGIEGIRGVVIICNELMGALGDLVLVRL